MHSIFIVPVSVGAIVVVFVDVGHNGDFVGVGVSLSLYAPLCACAAEHGNSYTQHLNITQVLRYFSENSTLHDLYFTSGKIQISRN